jgi:tRNA 5-methylaminomethyl-2-thiouridine biosynthesis bifunctional protein
MRTEAVVPAQITRDADGTPFSPVYGDVYHPAAGAATQARHVFLAGNGLPDRWRGRDRFVVLETGFGLGNNFLATWDAWRRDPTACERLQFISIERHPPTREDLRVLPREPALSSLGPLLADAWPPLTPNLHRLDFDGGRVQLLLAFGDVAAWLPELVARVDAFYLDGFAPARNPLMWQPRLFKAMARLAAPGATAATWTAARAVRDGLAAAGFQVRAAPGAGGKRDITLASFAPAFVPRSAPARSAPSTGSRHAVIVGGGLAGCATAWALADQGWHSLVLDRHEAPAREASGNPAGLFHGVVHRDDGTHARFNRAAALAAQQAVRQAIETDGAAGELRGLLRLETSGAAIAGMHETLASLGLPPDYVRAVDAAEATQRAGLALRHPAWFYPGGGWVDPAALARSYLRRAGARAAFRGAAMVGALRRHESRWQVLDHAGEVLAEADAVILANAGDAFRLLAPSDWPARKVRGQVSMAHAGDFALPRVPVAGSGYLLPEVAGQAVFGATAQVGDEDASPRLADHVQNLEQLTALIGERPRVGPERLSGRVGWRWVSDDRLPLVGAVPAGPASLLAAGRLDQPRLVPRVPGLYLFTALGSRGITWSALGARSLASWVTGGPSPVEASLLDALDPARFIARDARRAAATG